MSAEKTTGGQAAGPCEWCASYHHGKCSLVSAIEYFADRTIKRVEFHSPAGSRRAVEYFPWGAKRRVELAS